MPIFEPCGVLFFFPTEEPYFRDSVAAHRELGMATEVLEAAEMARRFPMIDFDGISVGLFEPQFGALMARRSVLTLVDRFVRAGGDYVKGSGRCRRAPGIGRMAEVRLSSGERIGADRFVFALGPWLPKLFPDVIGAANPADPAGNILLRAAPRRPAVPPRRDALLGRLQYGDMFYGFPDLESRGVKFAHDVARPSARSRYAGPAPDGCRARRGHRLP